MNSVLKKSYEIAASSYLLPTPAGAFYAVQSRQNDPVRKYLRFLLSQSTTPLLDEKILEQHIDADLETAMSIIYRMQELGYLQAVDEPIARSAGTLESMLPPFLEKIVDTGKAVLADEQGFYLSLSGFAHEAAEELSALSANLHTIQERHQKLLNNNLGVKSSAWGVIDAAGNSEVGFWPLYFPRDRFTLILSGVPQLNSVYFTHLVACLAMRYNN